jgi:predicted transcriptional regulator
VNTSAQEEKSVGGQATTSTTDTLTDPYHSIEVKAKNKGTSNPIPSIHNPSRPEPIDKSLYNTDHMIYNKAMDTQSNEGSTHSPQLLSNEVSTNNPSLLPRLSAQRGITRATDEYEVEDEASGPSRNAVELLKGIKDGVVIGKELTVDERRLVVKSMKELGQTQDAIAELIKVSRRTIVNDYAVLRREQALAIQATETSDIAGEVYDVARTCIRRALQAGSFKTVSTIMRDMVEVLQSLGVVYRAPKTSMQASLYGDMSAGVKHNGFQKYMDGIGNDKSKVIEVLDCMFNTIDKDGLN